MYEGDGEHAAMRRSTVWKVMLRLRHRKTAVPEMRGLGKIYQNGFNTTIRTMTIISSAGTSFIIRQCRWLFGRSS